jgi:hypothetical protein
VWLTDIDARYRRSVLILRSSLRSLRNAATASGAAGIAATLLAAAHDSQTRQSLA